MNPGTSHKGRARFSTIFVLDDDPAQADMTAQALSGQHHRIRTFYDPLKALAALSDDRPDLFITDLSMPWIDGRDVVESARVRQPDLQILLLSAFQRGAEVAAAKQIDFLRKPVELGHLLAAVNHALQARGASYDRQVVAT